MGWLMVFVLGGTLLTGAGCQPWQQKYEACVQEKENLDALFTECQQSLQQCGMERDQMAGQVVQLQQRLSAAQQPQPRVPSALEREGGVWDLDEGTITMTLPSDGLFDAGKADLKSTSKSRLQRIANVIRKEHPGKAVYVVGHTDTDPIRKSKWKDTWELSCARALAVTRYLVEQGVSPKQLAAVGRSEYHPVGSNKAQNRRVEIVVAE
jgi:flagellar motor protein MotB